MPLIIFFFGQKCRYLFEREKNGQIEIDNDASKCRYLFEEKIQNTQPEIVPNKDHKGNHIPKNYINGKET